MAKSTFIKRLGLWVTHTARTHFLQRQYTSPGEPINPRMARPGTKRMNPRRGRCGCEYCKAKARPLRDEINYREQMKEINYV